MIKNIQNISSIVTEVYKIEQKKTGFFGTKKVKIEVPVKKEKNIYNNCELSSYEVITQSKDGSILRKLGKISTCDNEEKKEVIKYIYNDNDVLNRKESESVLFKDKHNNTYLHTSYDSASGSKVDSVIRYELLYDLENRLIKEISFYKGYKEEKIICIREFEYDDRGHCIKRTTKDYDNCTITKEEVVNKTYDSSGNCLREEEIKLWGLEYKNKGFQDSKTIREYERNKHGDIIHYKRTCNDQLICYAHYELKYDLYDNCIEERCYETFVGQSETVWLTKYMINYK